MQTLAFRLVPGTDVRKELRSIAKKEHISAAVVLGAVGSLTVTCLRFAGQPSSTRFDGKQEILTLSGTLGNDGIHLHMSVADEKGQCRGGHVSDGCIVNTTLELVIGILPEFHFKRLPDDSTGYKELVIEPIIDSSLLDGGVDD